MTSFEFSNCHTEERGEAGLEKICAGQSRERSRFVQLLSVAKKRWICNIYISIEEERESLLLFC